MGTAGGPVPVYIQRPGGVSSALDVTTTKVVKSSPGVLVRVVVVAPGSAGTLTINDNNSTSSGNSAANEIYTIAYTGLAVGQVIWLNWPCVTGITISAIPTAAQLSVSYF
jgi:hypothetical protein